MYSKDRSSIYITKSIIEIYKIHCNRSGSIPFQTLDQLAKSLTADYKIKIGVYSYRIGREAKKTKSGQTLQEIKYTSKKIVRVPIDVSQYTTNADEENGN
jgi:hypothetical protein